MKRRTFLALTLLSGCATLRATKHAASTPDWLGYTQYQTSLPTRFDNQVTMRAAAVRADGTGGHLLAPELAEEPNAWTQFAGWSPDGRHAIIGRGWETSENGAWEEEHKTFRMTEGWLYDVYLVELATGAAANITAVERVSPYNSGVFFLPDGSGRMGFTALIDGISHPFTMDADGRNKRDLSSGADGFSYGFSASPDGTRVAYHKDYQIYVAAADGSNPVRVETGNPFNFVPQWSPDGAWLLFVSGEHYNCHPCLARPDGTGFRKIADRGGFDGVMTVYDVFDFHGGSSDVPVWSIDGRSVFYTSRIGGAVELMRITVDDGRIERLTKSAAGVFAYHPKPSPDGRSLAFGSTRTGTRQLYVMSLEDGEAHAVTAVEPGHGAMWAHWKPASMESIS